MTNNLARFESQVSAGVRKENLHITAYVGPVYDRDCMQFTIGESFTCLNSYQLRKLVEIINKRLAHKKGYCATDADKDVVITGTKVEESVMLSRDELDSPNESCATKP